MRAVVMRQGQLLIEDVPAPVPRQGEVLVRTLACGVCGTDVHALHDAHGLAESARRSGGGFAANLDPDRDVILGHEFCAEVVGFGPGTVRRVRHGAIVCARAVLERDARREVIGFSNVVPGGLAEYMVLSEERLLEVPAGLSPIHAALAEPFAVGIHAVGLADLGPDDQPLVVGCGPVGLAVVAALAATGRRSIVAADFSENRRQMALALGADVVVDPAATSPYEELDSGVGRAAIFECVGAPGMLQAVMEGAPAGARIIVLGVCTGTDSFEPMLGIHKELSLQFSVAYTDDEFAEALRAIGDGRLPVDRIGIRTVGLDGVVEAVAELQSPGGSQDKLVVDPTR